MTDGGGTVGQASAGNVVGDHTDAPGRTAILSTLDTKRVPATRLGQILQHDLHAPAPWFIDLSVRPATAPAEPAPDTTRDDLLERAGLRSDDLEQLDKSERMQRFADAAAQCLIDLVEKGTVTSVIGLGGGQGTWLCLRILEQLPPTLTRVLLTTSPNSLTYTADRVGIVIVPSVTDVAGGNPILDRALASAGGAALAGQAVAESAAPLVALTMFGVTTPGAEVAREVLEEAGFAVAVFHANGLGGAAMERRLHATPISAVLDLTTSEIVDELAGGVSSAGPDRLTEAARLGIPQVVVPGAVDVINFRAPETVPRRYRQRTFYSHTPSVTLMRTSSQESATVGTLMAERLNQSCGPVSVLIPTGGFSALDAPGEPFWDPEADAAFTSALQAALRADIPVRLLPHHINDPEFGQAAAREILRLLTITSPARS